MNQGASTRILVAEAEPGTRHHICEYLAGLGYQPEGADNGPEAVRLLERNQYALILLDQAVTTASGGDLTPQLAAAFPHVPIIVMTASPSVPAVIKSLRQGVFDYVIKPYEILDLSTIIPRAIERYYTRMEELQSQLAESNAAKTMAKKDTVRT